MGMLYSYVSMRAGCSRSVESGDTRAVIVVSFAAWLPATGYRLPVTRKNERFELPSLLRN
jgi:hypothetical protein